ncbi:macrophage mannose receptor 1-like [Silurus meridionalis]|nr:macrophage mannose receptor 1-like [Silurus meridionalis]
MYTDLATLETPAEIAQIQNIAKSQNSASTTWIGLYNDVNSWRWSMGNVSLGSFSNWYPPNPDNYLGKESCGAMVPAGWSDDQCETPLTFICFDESYTGTSSYIFINMQLTWSDAQSYCRPHHTDLASVRNSAENSIVKSLSVSGGSWFGLFRDTWKWSDQTNFNSIPWLAGQPDNSLKQENCVLFLNGVTADVLCSKIIPFFCETVITGKKQIARLKIKSNQDVDDPGVKVAILDKIRQMFSNKGNITVRWRQQSDGLVFKRIKGNRTTTTFC